MEDPLYEFGEAFIKEVRDNVLPLLEAKLTGTVMPPISILDSKISKLSSNEIEILRELSYKMVDQTLFHTLRFFYEESHGWKIANEEEKISDISKLSDSFLGELNCEDGFIELYSKYPKFS
jgi:hypothetical protein